ncbi:hypothetical protein CYMTET_5763 [Cymbomonas tetramitiformis]|uniref:Calmodulin n=1 Tax=Cymbomonas tetramitiformis TaxID=36881 RepID=A0AAE0LIJ6_9CHLO|nr:hypothetical protein CYMTET_5763 [Cymbomonas tetramitiformis]
MASSREAVNPWDLPLDPLSLTSGNSAVHDENLSHSSYGIEVLAQADWLDAIDGGSEDLSSCSTNAASSWQWLLRPPPDLMYALRTYLKTRGIRIQHLFDEFDEDGIGALDALQFGRLARRLIPEARDEDVKYFQAMLDSDGEGHVTCEGLIDGLEELARLEVQNQGEVGQKDELKRVTAHLRQRPRDFERIAEGFEEYGHGYLSPREALWLVNEIVSDLSPNELRHLLARLKGVAAKDGYTTPGDLLYALRLDSTAALDLYRAEQADLPPAEYKKDSTWSLEVAMRDGHCFLVDRETSKVFSDIGDGRWPALYGRISAGDVVGAASTGLLEELVAVLRRGRQEFLEAFEFIQNNPDEALDASRVLRVIKRLVPMATEDDLQHFKAAAAFHRVQQFSLARFATLVERLRTAELERTAWASALEVDVLRQVAVLIDRHRFRVLEAYEQGAARLVREQVAKYGVPRCSKMPASAEISAART